MTTLFFEKEKQEIIKSLALNNYRELQDGTYEKYDLIEKVVVSYSFHDDHYHVTKKSFNNKIKSEHYYFNR